MSTILAMMSLVATILTEDSVHAIGLSVSGEIAAMSFTRSLHPPGILIYMELLLNIRMCPSPLQISRRPVHSRGIDRRSV